MTMAISVFGFILFRRRSPVPVETPSRRNITYQADPPIVRELQKAWEREGLQMVLGREPCNKGLSGSQTQLQVPKVETLPQVWIEREALCHDLQTKGTPTLRLSRPNLSNTFNSPLASPPTSLPLPLPFLHLSLMSSLQHALVWCLSFSFISFPIMRYMHGITCQFAIVHLYSWIVDLGVAMGCLGDEVEHVWAKFKLDSFIDLVKNLNLKFC